MTSPEASKHRRPDKKPYLIAKCTAQEVRRMAPPLALIAVMAAGTHDIVNLDMVSPDKSKLNSENTETNPKANRLTDKFARHTSGELDGVKLVLCPGTVKTKAEAIRDPIVLSKSPMVLGQLALENGAWRVSTISGASPDYLVRCTTGNGALQAVNVHILESDTGAQSALGFNENGAIATQAGRPLTPGQAVIS